MKRSLSLFETFLSGARAVQPDAAEPRESVGILAVHRFDSAEIASGRIETGKWSADRRRMLITKPIMWYEQCADG